MSSIQETLRGLAETPLPNDDADFDPEMVRLALEVHNKAHTAAIAHIDTLEARLQKTDKAFNEQCLTIDSLEARVAELEGLLGDLVSLKDNWGPFGGEIYQDKIDRAWAKARAALNAKRGG